MTRDVATCIMEMLVIYDLHAIGRTCPALRELACGVSCRRFSHFVEHFARPYFSQLPQLSMHNGVITGSLPRGHMQREDSLLANPLGDWKNFLEIPSAHLRHAPRLRHPVDQATRHHQGTSVQWSSLNLTQNITG